jgi:two-component system, NarL family, invasion response regulator UvrY
MTINVVLVDDHPIVRLGLKTVISSADDIEVAGELDNIKDLLNFDFTDTQVLLLDLSLHSKSSLPEIRGICDRFPHLKILVISIFRDDQYVVRAMQAGAAGYMSKDVAGDGLADAIRTVNSSKTFFSDRIKAQAESGLTDNEIVDVQSLLSGREYEVFVLVGRGLSTKEISEHLSVNPKTVSTYKRRILDKLKISGRAQLVRYAVKFDSQE